MQTYKGLNTLLTSTKSHATVVLVKPKVLKNLMQTFVSKLRSPSFAEGLLTRANSRRNGS